MGSTDGGLLKRFMRKLTSDIDELEAADLVRCATRL